MANNSNAQESASSVRYGKGVFLGHDCTHVDARKRTLALESAGVELKGFFFRREKNNADYQPEWDNVELGITADNNYAKRVPALLKGLKILVDHKQDLRSAKFIMARNFDMMFIGMLAKVLTGSKAKLIYDVPDIQEFFFGKGLKGKVFRGLEKIILNQISLLVVTSPGFIRGYFEKYQNYNGKHFVWENKLLSEQMGDMPTPEQMNAHRVKPEEGVSPWVVCWHGTLRCPASMKILADTAKAMGSKVKFYLRGKQTIYPELFEQTFSGIENVEFGGEYRTPDDLEEIYGSAHFNWCADYFDPEGNSPLLLPNRVYQGGALGVVPLTISGQESANYVAQHNLGYVLPEASSEALIAFLKSADWDEYLAARDRNYQARDTLFLEDASDLRQLLNAIDAS
ncbi:glycosyltransferase family protein [Hirschia baltica]|uniref:Putative glucosyltransferase protein n=1 Tax=Hirschia baltica (strain ATCC 49814 / DSM 5838 / IFAM 1418) TaxID=582402 RepID=C6XR45_HIRBI|nr:glucosyltransferase [Hirschia baltica]ACT60576.1 putative glucosyltransferase protein [Hirschia baltica ATCC 49814]